jgi:hypothetical protein
MSSATLWVGNRANIVCAICQDEFQRGEERWTHEGGQAHEPFHRNCLNAWLKRKAVCPLDRTPINPNSLLTRAEIIYKRCKRFFVNLSCALPLGTAAGLTNTAWNAIAVHLKDELRIHAMTYAFDISFAKARLALVGVEATILLTGTISALGIAAVLAFATFHRLKISDTDQFNIWAGTSVGVMAASAFLSDSLSSISFLSGACSGMLTLVRA